MAEGYVQAPADNTGKKVDSTELTNSTGSTVERLRMVVPDGMNVSGSALELLLLEYQITNTLIAQAFGLDADLQAMRNTGDA